MEVLEQQGEMWGNLSGDGIFLIIAIIVIVAVGWFLYRLAKIYLARMAKEVADKQKIMSYARPLPENTDKESEQKEAKTEELIGEGLYRAYVLKENCLEPTKIKRPIGNLFMADTSMPVAGACYLVKIDAGKLVPYDPRELPFKSESSPQWAYFATHWGIVGEVYMSIKNWWQMAPAWVAVVSVTAAILIVMVVLG